MPMFRVDSEVGRLRQVILHRPGLELKRLTPDNAADLLAQTLDVTAARDYILDRVFDSRWHGPLAAEQLRAAVAGLDSPVLAGCLVGGITKQEISELAPEPKSIAF